MKYLSFILLFILIQNIDLSANEAVGASLSGYVRDASTEETLVSASVFIEGTNLGSYTNKSGFFSITGIPAGKYAVRISSISYSKLTDTIEFKKNESIRKTFKLEPQSIFKDEITVVADREAEKREIVISKVNIPVKQIKQIRIGGESDVFRSLQMLPGILTSSQISSGLFVRGGSPDQNLVLLDGSKIYNPTHLFGFISTFNTEAIKDVELIKGAYPAEYGSRLSAVLNITQKDGNRKEFQGLASVGAISSRLSLQGPIGNGSWFIGGRRTYLELVTGLLEEDPNEPYPDFNFYDVNAKITQNISKNDVISLSGFVSSDVFDYSSYGFMAGLDLGNIAGSMRWTHIFGDDMFSVINYTTSHYYNDFEGGQSGFGFEINNSITDQTLKGSLEWFTNDHWTNKFGFEVTEYEFNYFLNFSGDRDSIPEEDPGSSTGITDINVIDWNYSVFAQTNYRIGEIISLQAGIRANYWDLSGIASYDPRVAIKYNINENHSLKAAWGIFHQNLRLASQPNFSFFDTWLPTDSTVDASRAIHYVFSYETTPFKGYDFNFDIYYKVMENVSEINPLQLEANTTSDVFYLGNAESYGVEFFIQKKYGRLTGWIGYALGYIFAQFDEINRGKEFRPKYDRRHDLKIVAQYAINEQWNVGGSFIFQSGQSFTGATSLFKSALPGATVSKGIIVPSQRYGLRLPPSHQLNLNGSYSFKIYGFDLRVIVDIYNVYNRRDILTRFYNTRDDEVEIEDVRLLPILPTISFEIEF